MTKSPDEIRNDIEDTRSQLGDTVEALSAKTDVKARVHTKAEEVKTTAAEKINPIPIGIAVAVIVAFVVWRRIDR